MAGLPASNYCNGDVTPSTVYLNSEITLTVTSNVPDIDLEKMYGVTAWGDEVPTIGPENEAGRWHDGSTGWTIEDAGSNQLPANKVSQNCIYAPIRWGQVLAPTQVGGTITGGDHAVELAPNKCIQLYNSLFHIYPGIHLEYSVMCKENTTDNSINLSWFHGNWDRYNNTWINDTESGVINLSAQTPWDLWQTAVIESSDAVMRNYFCVKNTGTNTIYIIPATYVGSSGDYGLGITSKTFTHTYKRIGTYYISFYASGDEYANGYTTVQVLDIPNKVFGAF